MSMMNSAPSEQGKVWDYLRHNKKFPNVWCAGCGIGIVLHAIIRAVDRMGVSKDDVAMVTGIGCTGRMSAYVDFHTLHTTHGRALAFATGLKMAKPDMHVVVVMGDGDALAIGGNHFIHAARRNIDLTAIVVNNHTYGMTGGQASPTTPHDMLATTTPYGNIEPSFPIDELAAAAGAVFVARSTVYHAVELDRLIEKALLKRGFSLVEAVSYCHTSYGKLNKMGSAVDMMRALKDQSMTLEAASRLTPEERKGKIVRGIMVDRELPEYTDLYAAVTERAKAQRF
jgi:2-oxoglutarate/2-oxoacid ferredoxin oxidoreductase subunit beta